MLVSQRSTGADVGAILAWLAFGSFKFKFELLTHYSLSVGVVELRLHRHKDRHMMEIPKTRMEVPIFLIVFGWYLAREPTSTTNFLATGVHRVGFSEFCVVLALVLTTWISQGGLRDSTKDDTSHRTGTHQQNKLDWRLLGHNLN